VKFEFLLQCSVGCSGNIMSSQNATHDSRYSGCVVALVRLYHESVRRDRVLSHPAIILICNHCVEVDLSRL
jgi:hypothetical protein